MNSMIDEFNQTLGREHGVKVVVTSISNSTAIHDALVSAAHDEVGSPELPDIFTCYPKTLKAMGSDLALDWHNYFSNQELQAFVPEFLEEGKFADKLLIFPISKSSNALFINANAYEKFAAETGHTYQDLATWDGFFDVTSDYYNWSGGQSFFMYDDWIHYPLLNLEAYGAQLFKNEAIDWQSSDFKRVMRPLMRAGIRGEVCLMPGYSTKAIMIDKAIAGVESTASVLYFKDIVTHQDNSTTELRVKALAVPYFSDGQRLALQRGTGLVALKSTKEKEKAAALFCQWLSSEKINLEFAMHGGYLPTRQSNFNKLQTEIDSFKFPRERFRSLYETVVKIYQDNSFVVAPSFAGYGDVEQAFPKALRKVLAENHELWKNSTRKDDALLDELTEASLLQLQEGVNSLLDSEL